MSRFILKRSPESDQYIEFSSIVDAPVTGIMSRGPMLKHLKAQYGVATDQAARLARTDRTGTSALAFNWYGWAEGDLCWMEGRPDGVPRALSHEAMFEALGDE